MKISFLAKLFGCEEDKVQLDLNDANLKIKQQQEQINQLQEAINKLTSQQVKVPDELGRITYSEIRSLLLPYCSNLYISDNWFSLTSIDQASAFTQESNVAYQKYVAEMHDCDNFSSALWGYWSDSLKSFALGIAWSQTHAFNVFVDNNKKIYIVEPQNNAFIPIENLKDNTLYLPLRLVVI